MKTSYIIKTDRLILRKFNIKDKQAMYRLNSDPEVLKYTGNKPFKDILEAEKFILDYQYKYNSGLGRLAVTLKEDDTFIGWCGLNKNEENEIDIGFRLLKSFWNNGYATEAAKECIHYGFSYLNLNMIVGRADERNLNSIHVLEKINMVYWKEKVMPPHGLVKYFRILRKHGK